MAKRRFHYPSGTAGRLVSTAMFALAFGWLEAVIVVYLRKLIGLEGTLDSLDPRTQEAMLKTFAGMRSRGEGGHLSPEFLLVEQTREAATIAILLAVGWLAGGAGTRRAAHAGMNLKRRAAYFFLAFGIWDIAYYAALWVLLRWPPSPRTLDVLFLIPFPWVAQVWIPVAISMVFIAGALWALGGDER